MQIEGVGGDTSYELLRQKAVKVTLFFGKQKRKKQRTSDDKRKKKEKKTFCAKFFIKMHA